MKAEIKTGVQRWMLVVMAIITAASWPGTALAEPDAESPESNWEARAEEVQIMGRVLVKVLQGFQERAPEVSSDSGKLIDAVAKAELNAESFQEAIAGLTQTKLAQTLALASQYNTGDYNLRGFVVPGSGAFIALDVAVPMREVDADKSRPADPDDLWDKTADEMSGARNPYADFWRSENQAKHYALDPHEVERLTDAVICAVGKHGHRMEHFGGECKIVVCMNFRGSLQSWDPYAGGLFYGAAGHAKGNSLHVVIEVPFNVLRDQSDRQFDFDRFKRQVRITQYGSVRQTVSTGTAR